MARKLRPPKNARETRARCCETCYHLIWHGPDTQCERPNGPWFDVADRNFLYYVCDGWKFNEERSNLIVE